MRSRRAGILAGVLTAGAVTATVALAAPAGIHRPTALLSAAAAGPLSGILGFETRPLVSVDYKGDTRSGIVDALSTMVTGETQVKILAWYDNEWGYANRLVELARTVALSIA